MPALDTFNIVYAALILLLTAYVIITVFSLRKRDMRISTAEDDIDSKANAVLEDARIKSQKILDDAILKSQEILSETETLKKNIEEKISGSVSASIEKYSNDLSKSSGDIISEADEFKVQLDSFVSKTVNGSLDSYLAGLDKNSKDLNTQVDEFKAKLETYFSQSIYGTADKYVDTLEKSSGVIVDNTHVFQTNIEKYANDVVYKAIDSYAEELSKNSTEIKSSYLTFLDTLKNQFAEDQKRLIDDIEGNVRSQIDGFSQTILAKTDAYGKYLDKYLEQADGVIIQVEEVGKQQIEQLVKNVSEHNLTYQQVLEQKVNDEFAKTQAQLEEYKAKKMQKIDEALHQILYKLSTDLLGKAINLDDHEKLVVDALEAAKKDNVFTI